MPADLTIWHEVPKMAQSAVEMIQSYHALVREEIIPLTPKTGGTLLDFGGGIGATAMHLKTLGLVERAGVVDLVAEKAEGLDLDFRFAGDVENPALIDRVIAEAGPFSVILCLDILEHLRDPWAVIRQLHQGLADNGVIVASIPNVRNFRAVLPLVLHNKWTLTDAGILDRTHLRFFVRDTAIELMQCSGLKVEEVVAAPSGGRRVKYFRAATLGLLNSFTDRQYLIRARKVAPR